MVFVLVLLALAGGVLLTAQRAPQQPPVAAVTGLSMRWTGEQNLQVVAVGYRRREIAEVRVGSSPWRQVRADDNGAVTLTVPVDRAAAGTTVVVSGRAAAGGSRSLAGGVPPAVAARGPVDLVPWVVSGVLVLIALGAAFAHRPGARRRDPVAAVTVVDLPRGAHPGAHRRPVVGGRADTRPSETMMTL
ncbi:hypothetical protein KRMM14A1259_09600 [Krasilnikovia sp. MM14-A1259]